jgi:hypothetical protein
VRKIRFAASLVVGLRVDSQAADLGCRIREQGQDTDALSDDEEFQPSG